MIKLFAVLIAILPVAGCAPTAFTRISVHPTANLFEANEVANIATSTAMRFGLEEIERRKTDLTFVDAGGRNPYLWLTVYYAPNSARIDLAECYVDNPTDRHKNLAQSIIGDFESSGYSAQIVYQTPDARQWPVLVGLAGIVLFVLVVRRLRSSRASAKIK